MKINRKDIIKLFDTKRDEIQRNKNITSLISVIGEDLGSALFKHYIKNILKKKIIIGGEMPKTGKKRGPRLDRWIYVEDKRNKWIAYQTEIKNSSAYAIGGYNIMSDNEVPAMANKKWLERKKWILNIKLNSENKVFQKMKHPDDLPEGAKIEPLLIYWWPLSKKDKYYFAESIRRGSFKKLNIFSMSNYLRSLKNRWLDLDMPIAQERIKLLKRYFKW